MVSAMLASVLLVPSVSAHDPLASGNNESLATATLVPDPTKSWAIYAELHEGGEAQYYRFDISAGQRIHVMLLKPTSSGFSDFKPGFVLMGPGIANSSVVPGFVNVSAGSGAAVFNGSQPAQANYEPFSPSAFYQVAEVSIEAPADGTYYVAVFEANRGGHYGLAIGDRESFTLADWLLMPFSLLRIYEWEGQNLAIVLSPLAATVAVGMGLLYWRQRKGVRVHPPALVASLAGFFFIGGGLTVFSQMAFALTQAPVDGTVGVTLIFVAIPLILGVGVLRLAFRHGSVWTLKQRIYLAALGIIALSLWTGYLVGPVLAFMAAAMPTKTSAPVERETQA